MKGPGGQQFYDYVQNRGLSFVDAFLLTNFHRLQQRVGDTARETAREQARSKDHVTGAGAVQSEKSAAVPPEVLALFRDLNPGVSDSEFQSYYDKYKRRK